MGKKLTTLEFIEKDKAVHGAGYKLYDRVTYVNNCTKVELGCGINPDHGYYWQNPSKSLQGQGCPSCAKNAKLTTPEFIAKHESVHGVGTTLYDRVDYVNSFVKIELGCGVDHSHGYYSMRPNNALNGQGCPKCGRGTQARKRAMEYFDFVEKDQKVNGIGIKLYDKVVYTNNHTKVELGCAINPDHGYYWMKPSNSTHRAQGCPKCGRLDQIENRLYPLDHRVSQCTKIHNGKYKYHLTVKAESHSLVVIVCPDHGEFKQSWDSHARGTGCPKCVGQVSKPEKEISEFLTGLGIEHETSIRSVISPYELDLYIPSKEIALEYCGLYWHSEVYRDSNYHYKKWKMCKDQGIQLITIFEDEWVLNKEVVKRLLANKVGAVSKSLFARKCEFTYTTKTEASALLNEHHIQGASNASHYTGLIRDGSIVAVALFKRRDEGYELVRYCSSVRVVGGLSKLIKNFRKDHPGPIHTFADHRYSSGPLYIQAGFKESGSIPQDYKYIVKGKTHHKFAFRHKSLSTKIKNYDPNLTEHENCLAAGILRIYDCGKTRFIYY